MAGLSKRLLPTASFVLLGFGLAAGCGGQSFQENDSGGAGESGDGGVSGTSSGSGGSGGTSGSGSPTTGGSPATGGASPAGGVPPTGGVGTSGTAGAAGEPNVCALAPDAGPCRGAFQRFAFDPRTGVCLPFMYGGCEGNENNFETAESCYAACSAFGPMLTTSCNAPPDCTLVPARCCGGCNEATLLNTVAVRKGQESAFQGVLGCHTIDCVPCEPTSPNPWLGATCSSGRCVAFDARQTALTACTTAADCELRNGLECCEGCLSSYATAVALNKGVDPGPLLCGDAEVACDACVPTFFGLSPTCESGQCNVLVHPI